MQVRTTTTKGDQANATPTGRSSPSSPGRRRSVWTTGAVAAGVAASMNIAIWLLGRGFDVRFVVPGRDGGSPIDVELFAVLASTVVPIAVGTALFAGALRRGRRWPRRVLWAAAVVAVGSLAMPLSADADGATTALLAAMHVVAGATFVVAMDSVLGAAQVQSRKGTK